MDAVKIEKLLTEVMVGGNMSSLQVAGVNLVISFLAENLTDISNFSINTDGWVFVEDEGEELDCENLDKKDFFEGRRDILVKLYDLTGYDIKSVSLFKDKFLKLVVDGRVVWICPHFTNVDGVLYYDSWRVITNDDRGFGHWLVQLENEDVFINLKHPLISVRD